MRKLLEIKLTCAGILSTNRNLVGTPCKIYGTILKKDEERTRINWPEDKKANEDAWEMTQTDYVCQEKEKGDIQHWILSKTFLFQTIQK